MNTYGYVYGSPVSFSDPKGLAAWRYPRSHPHCLSLQRKIENHRKELDDRWDELARNPLSLPERIGPGEKQSQTKRGHRKLINKHDSQLRYWEKRYDEECGDDDSCGTGCSTATSTIAIGATGYVVYRCLRMIPSLAPPLWWSIPANAVTP